MKVPLMVNCTPTGSAAKLDRNLHEHYTCLGSDLSFPLGPAACTGLGPAACVGLNCNDCALHNPHGAATVGSVALKIATAETHVSAYVQAHLDQYLDLKDILPLLKPQREPS